MRRFLEEKHARQPRRARFGHSRQDSSHGRCTVLVGFRRRMTHCAELRARPGRAQHQERRARARQGVSGERSSTLTRDVTREREMCTREAHGAAGGARDAVISLREPHAHGAVASRRWKSLPLRQLARLRSFVVEMRGDPFGPLVQRLRLCRCRFSSFRCLCFRIFLRRFLITLPTNLPLEPERAER
jgi:hypothetical protein